MLGILDSVIEFLSYIPDYILYAIETAWNGWIDIIDVALEGANALLGGLPETISPPGYIEEINWYYPVGTLLGIAAPLVTAYIAWLGISWLYRKFGSI